MFSKICKFLFATKLAVCYHYTADVSLLVKGCCVVNSVCVGVWMLCVGSIDGLESQLAAELTTLNHYRALSSK